MQIYFVSKKHTESIYIQSIYIEERQKVQKIASILWVSYGYVMGILWCSQQIGRK